MAKKIIKFHFFDNGGLGSWLIKSRLSTTVSHCGMEFENGDFFHSSFLPGVVNDRDYLKSHVPVSTSEIAVDPKSYEQALHFCRTNEGRTYDRKAILGFILGTKLQNAESYFCSEIGRRVFEEATNVRLFWPKLCAPHELRIMADTFIQAVNMDEE